MSLDLIKQTSQTTDSLDFLQDDQNHATLSLPAETKTTTHHPSDMTDSFRFLWSLGGAALLFGLFYRLRLLYNLYFAIPSYRAFQPKHHSVLDLLQTVWLEWAWSVQVVAAGWVLWWGSNLLLQRYPGIRKPVVVLGWIALHLVFLVSAFLYGSHLRAMFDVQSGLTYDLWLEGRDAFGPQDLLRFMSIVDISFLALPTVLFWSLWLCPVRYCLWRNRILLLLSVFFLGLPLWPRSVSSRPLDQAVQLTPIQFLVSDYLRVRRNRTKPNALEDETAPEKPDRRQPHHDMRSQPKPRQSPALQRPPLISTPQKPFPAQRLGTGRTQDTTLRLIADAFLTPGSPAKQIPVKTPISGQSIPPFAVTPGNAILPTNHGQSPSPPSGSPGTWNVLLYMLESVGTRYIFDTTRTRRMPMAYLHKISKEGWYFNNHYATANSSPRAIFSILTGLYPSPQLDMFEMHETVCTPTLYDFVRGRYDSFFMTPGSLHWYFPRHLFLNNGPKDLYEARNFRRFKKYGSFPNEIDVTTELIRRIQKAKEPFVASYLSFIPHGPYDDYGPKYRILPNIKRDLHRYYNNLYVLDLQIKRLMQALEHTGLLQRTIVIFVGDHGQAFGQHRRNWGHSRQSYNENYHAPLLFYQPQLFKPQEFSHRTSHVDLLPTLLDIMNIPYHPLLFQGESLFQRDLLRKQIFMFGNETTLSSIDRNNIKMQYVLNRRQCWVYDLGTDPDERKRLNCRPFAEQRKALREYLRLQPILRSKYNQTCRTRQPFFGLQHPTFNKRQQGGLAIPKQND